MRSQSGFTLIEIAIVLVIIGLLLGGVLKGEELVVSARVRELIAQQDGARAAFYGFQDRFRAAPGDYAKASINLRCPSGGSCLNGNGNGIIESNAAPINVQGVASENNEALLVWMHLASAGFIDGNYRMQSGATQPNDGNSPKNAYNIYLQLIYDNAYADSTGNAPKQHNLKTGAQIPVEILGEVDRKIDDGNGVRGEFRFSTYQGNAPAAPSPPVAVYSPGSCVSAAGMWFLEEGQSNCGGAGLL